MTDPMSTADIQSKVAQTRAQLESTLDEIEDKLNVPKQLGLAAKRARANYESDPVPWIAAVGAAAAVVGGIVVLAVASRK